MPIVAWDLNAIFKMAYEALPAGGVMMLHTIVKPSDEEFKERELPVTMTKLRFFKFIMDEIFPGGDLPQVNVVENHATKAGFDVKLVQIDIDLAGRPDMEDFETVGLEAILHESDLFGADQGGESDGSGHDGEDQGCVGNDATSFLQAPGYGVAVIFGA